MNRETIKEKFQQTIFRCFHCAAAIGVSTPEVLIVGIARLNRSVTIECALCRQTSYWKNTSESNKILQKEDHRILDKG